MTTSSAAKFWTLSFSGAGMLLPYHLGVARILKDSGTPLPIQAVAGSSSGAIAATFMALLPQCLGQYTNRFLDEGGRGLSLVKEVLEEQNKSPLPTKTAVDGRPMLYVCTTKSADGSMHLFPFDPKKSPEKDPATLFRAIYASCMIPRSFHPLDAFSRQALSYPDGVEIDGHLYCDGGISSPAPPTPDDLDINCEKRIVVSPISGPTSGHFSSIRPYDDSIALPFSLTCRCGSFKLKPSLQNLRAAFGSLGATTPDALRTTSKNLDYVAVCEARLDRD